MPDVHDPTALIRHAAQNGDRRLVELVQARSTARPPTPLPGADRACRELVQILGLAGTAGYDRQ